MVDKITIPNATSDTASVYKANIDNVASAHNAVAGAFHVSGQDTPDMTVLMGAGTMTVSGTLVVKTAQTSATITAPSVNPRIDLIYIDSSTGVIGVKTGTEAATPAIPTLTASQIACAQILLATSTTAITNSLITDARSFVTAGTSGGGGSGGMWTEIGTYTASSDGNLDMPLPSGYKKFRIEASDITVDADNGIMALRLQTEGGAYRDSSGDYTGAYRAHQYAADFSSQEVTNDSRISLNRTVKMGSDTNEYMEFSALVTSPRSSNRYTGVYVTVFHVDTTGDFIEGQVDSRLNTAEDNDEIRVTGIDNQGTPTVFSGTFTLYGLNES